MDPFISFAVALVIVALVAYAVGMFIPEGMPKFRQLLYLVAALGLFMYGLHLFGIMPTGCAARMR